MKTFKQFITEDQFRFSAFLVARLNMPQIKTISHFENYVQHLGINTSYIKVVPTDFRPTQVDFDQSKVDRIVAQREITSKPIIGSTDGYILDGHHRYRASLQTETEVNILVVDLDINKLLKLAMDYTELYG